MTPSIIQHPTEAPSKLSVSQRRFLTPYGIIVCACFAAVALLAFFTLRGPDGSFDPANLSARVNAMPRWAHGALTAALLAVFAIEFDFLGRIIASLFGRMTFGRNATPHRLALVRLVVQTCLLLVIMLGPFVAPRVFPAFHGWFALAVFAALALPTALSVWELCSGAVPASPR